jgi:hypothetical protein
VRSIAACAGAFALVVLEKWCRAALAREVTAA